MTERTAEVAGGGFAGLVAATALAQRGWKVQIHESSPALRSFGAGIFVYENGLRVLEALGAFDALEGRYHRATTVQDRMADGKLVAERKYEQDGGSRLFTMTRQTLHNALVKAAADAGVQVRTSSRIVAAEPDGALVDSAGTRWPADVVIGADGIRSSVRDSLFLLRMHEVFTFAVFRFLVPFATARRLGLDQISNYWDLDARRRILFVPCDDENLYLLLGANEEDSEALEVPINADLWRTAFPALGEVLHGLPDLPRFDRYEVLRLRRWSAGKVAIIGDAAHAMPPTFGQGAGTGMVNALSLAAYLSQEDSVVDALATWEARERPLTEQVQAGTVDFYRKMFTDEHYGTYERGPAEIAIMNYFPSHAALR
jgi:2-methyl-3-hydroxypyridine 5-carboxylic acid dioxygenase